MSQPGIGIADLREEELEVPRGQRLCMVLFGESRKENPAEDLGYTLKG
ncbi:hypothetical protein PRBEI_2000065900 [Prionailurus iriomotensis]